MAAVGVGVGGALLGGGRAARADNLTFLGNGSDQPGGSGTWTALQSDHEWLTANDANNGNIQNGIAWNNAGGTTAVFGAGANGNFTVTVDPNGVNAAGIVFNNSGYTIGGPGAINLSAGGTINSLVSNNTIAATLAGTGVTYAGTAATATTPIGSVAVTGANTYTGPTNITGGILSLATIANAGAGGTATTLGESSNASSNLILNGGQLAYTGGTATTDRGFTVGSAESVLNVSQGSTNLTFGGKIVGGTSILDKLGAGTVTFANTSGNSFGSAGLFILNGGVVLAGGTNTIGGTLRVGNNGNNGEFGNVLGPAYLTILGGTTTVSGSMLLDENAGSGNTDTVNLLNGATLITTGKPNAGNANQTGPGNTFFNVGGGSTYNSGSYVFTLSGYAGTTTTVNLGDGSAAPGTYIGQGLFDAAGTGTSTLNLNNATLLATISTSTFVSGISTVTVNGGGVTFNTSTYADTVSSNLSGGTGSGGLTKLGTGTLTLTGSDTYTGGNTVAAGTLDVENAGSLTSLTSGTNALATGTGLTLGVGGPTGFTDANLAAILAKTTFAGGNTLGLNTSGGNGTYSGNLAGNIALRKLGAYTLQLTGSNGYTGGTNVSAGVLEIGNAGSIAALTSNGANTNLVASGAALGFDLGGTTGFTPAQIATVVADTNFSSGALLGLFAANSNYNYSSSITGTVGVYTGGPNTLTLSGNNTYTGGTNVGSGTLVVGSQTALGSGNIVITGALDTNGYNVTAGVVTINGGTVTDSVGTGSLQGSVYNVSAGNVSNLGGTGRFNKVGTTTYAPTGINTYTGPTNVTAGILSLATIANGSTPSAIGASSNASGNLIVGGGQLLYTGPTATTDRGITFASGTDTINVPSGSALTFGGLAANTSNSSFVKFGNGTVAFTNPTGTNALSASPAYINVGTVALAGNASFGSSVYLGNNTLATATDAPTLNVSAGTTSGGSNSTDLGYYVSTPNVGLVSTLNVFGTGTYSTGYLYTTSTNSSNTPSAATTNSSVLNLSDSGKFNVANGAYLDYNYVGGGTTVNMTGTSAFTAGSLFVGYNGGATATFNQFGGSVTTNAMTLGNGNTSSAGMAIGIYNLGNGPGGSALLTATSVIGGAGTSTFNFNGGTLRANGSSATFMTNLTAANVLAGGAVINTNGFNDTIGQNLSSGTSGSPDGGLTKVGAGTLTLSGTNAYTGPTVINNGTLQYGSTTALPAGTLVTANAGGTLAFGGVALEPVGGTAVGLTLTGLNAAAGSAMQFNFASGSADAVSIAAAANVASGANITLAFPPGVPLTIGNYTLFQDTAGGLGNFNLSSAQSNYSSGGVVYGLTLTPTNTADVLNVSIVQSFRDYYTGATSNSLNTTANFSAESTGATAPSFAPGPNIDLVFSAANLNAANAVATLGGLSSVNALEFSSATPVTITGPGTLTLTGGAVSFAAGTGIVVDAGAAVPTISANLALPQTTTFVSNANASSAGATLISGVISGTGSAGLNLTSTAAAGAGGAFNLSGANTFSGPVNVSGGANLIVGTFNNGLAAGPLGMSSNASSNVLLQNGGTLTYTGGTAVTDRGITFGASSNTALNLLNVSSPATTLTFASPVASTGVGTAVILGNGTVTLAGTTATNTFVGSATNSSVGLYVLAGALTLGPGTVTADAGTLHIGNNGPSAQYSAFPADALMTVNGATLTTTNAFYMGQNDGSSHHDTLNVTNGSNVSISSILDASGGSAGLQGVSVVNVSGNSTFNVSSTVELGGDIFNVTGGNATLNLSDTSKLNFGYGGTGTVYIGDGGTGTLNLNGSGNVNLSSPSTFLGYGSAAALGTINLTGSTKLTNAGLLAIGYYGTGVVNQSGGTIQSGSTAYLGYVTSSTTGTGNGTLNMMGGTFNTSGYLYVGDNGYGTVNQTGGTVIVGITVYVGGNAGYSGTYTLGGGPGSAAVLIAPAVAALAGSGTLNFNGGTLQANANTTIFLTGLNAANVLPGGATIDTRAFNVSVGQALLASGTGGGLTKAGTGTLTLSGANTYNGNTTLAGGTLRVNGSTLASGTVLVPPTTTLGGSGSVGSVTVAGTITAGADAATVGTLTTAGETWNASGGYVAKVKDTTNANNDRLVMTGLTVAPGFAITVQPAPGATPMFTASNPTVTTTNGLPAGSYIVLATDTESGGPFTSSTTLAALNSKLTTTGVQPANGGDMLTLSYQPDGGGADLILEDVAVAAPEPTSLLLGGLAAVPLLVRRRRRRTAAVDAR